MQRRDLLAASASTLLLAACATPQPMQEMPPIVFVHGNGDSAAFEPQEPVHPQKGNE